MVIKMPKDIKIFQLRYEPIAEKQVCNSKETGTTIEREPTAIPYCSSGPCTVETRTHTQISGLP